MAYTVSLRTQEIGVRMALGASQRRILMMVLRRGASLIAIGALIGTVCSIWLSQFLASQLWGVSSHDLVAFVGALLIISFSGVAACYVPALRAMTVDPMVALRYE